MRAAYKLILATLLLQAIAASARTTLSIPAMITNITAGSTTFGCLFQKSDGSLWGMGVADYSFGGDYSNINVPRQLVVSNVVAAAVGSDFALFIESDGTTWGTGDNTSGVLGLTNYTYQYAVQPVEIPLSNVVAVAAESAHGHGRKARRFKKRVRVVAVAAGLGHSLFLESNGSLWGVGIDEEGQLGDGKIYGGFPPGPRQAEEIVSGGVTKIAAGSDFSLFIKSDGSLWGMGDNTWGQLGNETFIPWDQFTFTNLPEEIVSSNVAAIAAGTFHSLFLKSDGSLWAMGQNFFGQLGDGGNGTAFQPEMIVSNGVTAIAAGSDCSYFLKSDGSLWAMGDDEFGQLGDSNFYKLPALWYSTNEPEEIISSNVIAIAAGQDHALFLKADGSLWGMGRDFGLGDGFGNDDTSVPEQILPVPQPVLVESISSGTNLQFTATCGFGGNFYLLTTTNLSQPLPQWTPVWTNSILWHRYNTFSATLPNAVNSSPQQYYILQSH